ncbi:MAG: RNA-binding protein [Alphaproteobacteria bacterium]|nr:RNA-binding protein [Alphaproteobacteria bacterium]
MSRKLFVGNLPYSVTSERLQEAFSQFGVVTSSKVIVDRETGRSRGFAFLEMETDDQGAAAMQAMNGALLDGRSIAVREAVERQPGGGGGGYGGGGGAPGGGGGYRGAAPGGGGGGGGDGGPMRDRRADFSGPGPGGPGAPAPSTGFQDNKGPPRRRDNAPPRRERDYEPRKRGFDDDQ